MEPKVVNKCLIEAKSAKTFWEYDKEYSHYKQEGSGNNWAFGHNIHGPRNLEMISNAYSKLLENLDSAPGCFILQSLAGGTGSGLGSYLLEEFTDLYEDVSFLNIGVLPHQTGEVILQSYNTVLSMASLYRNSQGILLIENDKIQEICEKLLMKKSNSINDMNEVISHQLASVLLPCIDARRKKKIFSTCEN